MHLYQALQGHQFFSGLIQPLSQPLMALKAQEVLTALLTTSSELGEPDVASAVVGSLRRIQEGHRASPTSEGLTSLLTKERDLFAGKIRDVLRAQSSNPVKMPEQFEKTPNSAYADPHLFVDPSGRFYVWAPFTTEGRCGMDTPTVDFHLRLELSYQGIGDIFVGMAGELMLASQEWAQTYEQCRAGGGSIRAKTRDGSYPIELVTRIEAEVDKHRHEHELPLFFGWTQSLTLHPLKSIGPLSIPPELFPGEWRTLVSGLGVYLDELDPLFLPARTRGQQWEGWKQGLMTYQDLDRWIEEHPKATRPNISFRTWPAAVWASSFRAGEKQIQYGAIRLNGIKAMKLDQGECYILDDEGVFWKLHTSGELQQIESAQLPSEIRERWKVA